jgi:uncharacterized protein
MSLKKKLHNGLSSLGGWTLHNPYLVLFIITLLAALALQYSSKNLSINTDTAELIAPDAPFQQNRRKFEKAFSQDMHTLLLVVESDTPELTKSATKRLGRLLSSDKSNFVSVNIPNENQFFHQNGLLYLDPQDLQTISANLAQAQPFIGRISEQPNLTGFFPFLKMHLRFLIKTKLYLSICPRSLKKFRTRCIKLSMVKIACCLGKA